MFNVLSGIGQPGVASIFRAYQSYREEHWIRFFLLFLKLNGNCGFAS